MGTTLELLRQPMKLLEDVRRAVDEANSFEEECRKLGSRVESLGKSLRAVFRRIKEGNGCFCERPTSRIMEDCTRTLEKCCALVRRCKTTGILSRVIGITSAIELRRVSVLVDNVRANVEWLLNISTDEDTGMPGMPPIVSTVPMLAVVWAMIAKIQGGNPKAREGAASYLTFLSEQHGQLIVEEGGIPQLLKLLKDGTPEGQILAATTLGKLREYGREIAKDGGISAFLQILTDESMQLQAKVAWTLAEIISHDQEMQEEFGSANFIRPLVTLMMETMDDSSTTAPALKKAASLQSVVKSSMIAQSSQEDVNGTVDNSVATKSSGFVKDGMPDHGAGRELKGENQQFVSAFIAPSGSNSKGRQKRNVADSHYTEFTTRNMIRIEREKQPLEVKNDMKRQATRALWMLAQDNVRNSRMITETKAMSGFAKLIELEQEELQRTAIMAVVALAESAEIDQDLRKFAFKPNSPSAKALTNQLLGIINDPLGDSSLQESCIRAVGCLARTFSESEKRVIQCLVMKLSNSDDRHLTVAAETIDALLKFVDGEHYLHLKNAQNIVEASALPYLVQLVVWHDHNVQIPAIALLCQLVLHVGHTNPLAFQEAAALTVLKSVAASCSRLNRYVEFSLEDIVNTAITHLEFCEGEDVSHP